MSVGRYIMHQKLSDGSYEDVYCKSESGLIYRPNGRTVEQDLAAYLPEYRDSDAVPESLNNGKLVITPNHAYIGPSKIDLTADTKYVHPTAKQCNYSIDTSSFATKAEIDELEKKIAIGNAGFSSPVLGARVRIGGFDYMIVHFNSNIVYVITEDIIQLTRFGSSPTYSGSMIANLCSTWYSTNVPAALKSAGIFVNVTTEGVGSPCFIPTYNQCNGGFSYFNSDSRRCAQVASGGGTSRNYATDYWWTSTADSSNRVWLVGHDGGISSTANLNTAYGFRPCLAIARSAFS